MERERQKRLKKPEKYPDVCAQTTVGKKTHTNDCMRLGLATYPVLCSLPVLSL